MKLHDVLERAVWTFIQAFLAALVIQPATGLAAAGQAALLAGVSAVIASLTVVARVRLDALPNPGEGVPGIRGHAPAALQPMDQK